MKKSYLYPLLCLIYWGMTIPLQAQLTLERQVISSQGQLFDSNNLKSYSTSGEAVIATLSTNTLTATQGFQQPDILRVDAINHPSGLPFEFVAFPNPTSDLLTLQLEGVFVGPLLVELYDVKGRNLPDFQAEFIQTGQVQWQLGQLAEGVYMLRLSDAEGRLLGAERLLKQ